MSQASQYKAILFDVDGTLLDTAPSIAATINAMCEQHQRPKISVDQIRPQVSSGGRAMLKQAFDIEHRQHEAELFDQLIALYPNFITHELALFDGYLDLLNEIEQAGLIWGVVSNKPERFLKPQMQHVNLHHRTSIHIGGDTYKNKKPHPQPLLEACQLAGVSPREALYVGDCENDVIAAKRADMQACIVEFGYIPDDGSHTSWGANFTCTSPKHLSEQIITRTA